MTWAAATARMNAAMTGTFGETVVVVVDGTRHSLTAIMDRISDDNIIGDYVDRGVTATASCDTAVLTATGARTGCIVTAGSEEYTIDGPLKPDEGGMTRIDLKPLRQRKPGMNNP